jgi:hypothetical protein
VEVGVGDDDVDLVLGLAYLDIHLVITLNYGGLDSIWSPGLTYNSLR